MALLEGTTAPEMNVVAVHQRARQQATMPFDVDRRLRQMKAMNEKAARGLPGAGNHQHTDQPRRGGLSVEVTHLTEPFPRGETPLRTAVVIGGMRTKMNDRA